MTNLGNTHNIETAIAATSQSRRIIRLKQVMVMTGLSRSTIYDRMDQKSPRYDASFPKSIKLASHNLQSGAVGWEEGAVQQWIEQRIQACANNNPTA